MPKKCQRDSPCSPYAKNDTEYCGCYENYGNTGCNVSDMSGASSSSKISVDTVQSARAFVEAAALVGSLHLQEVIVRLNTKQAYRGLTLRQSSPDPEGDPSED